jgi:hypothetical protein
MRPLVLAAPFLLAACVAAPRPLAPDSAAAAFPVLRFFEGRTEGRGKLELAFGSPGSIGVQSRGRIEPDGTLVLRQIIEQSGKPARQREWRMWEVSPGRYAGTLTDASGPVKGKVSHNRLHLSFRMKGGLDAEQWLTLEPGGRSVRNIMVVRKFGLTVAAVDETIRKLD